MRSFGIPMNRIRLIAIALFVLVVIVPWLVEHLHRMGVFPWKQPLTASLLLGAIVLLAVVLLRREVNLRRLAERQYKDFLDAAPVGIYTVDRNGCFTYANPKLLELSGYGMEQQLHLSWKDLTHPDDIPLVESRIREAYQRQSLGMAPFEVRAFHRDGRLLHLILHYNLLEKDGLPDGFLIVAQDVTSRRKLEAQLVRSERLAAAGQLAMGLAHEINNPLSIMKTSLRLLRDRVRIGEDVEDIVTDIHEEVDRIAELVQVLMGFREERPGEGQETDVDEAMESLLHLMSPQMSEAQVLVDLAGSAEGVRAAIRPSQFRQVFFNLVRNALDAMPDGGTVHVSTEVDPEHVTLQVQDTGVGISQKDLLSVFEPFFSTKPSHRHGLGLYICYTLLKSAGGDVEVESMVGRGSTFTVRIPRVQS